MQSLIDEYERMPSRSHQPERRIVSCRGRMAGRLTHVQLCVDEEALDAAAPLTDDDQRGLQDMTPPDDVQAHVQARIAAMRRLKYG